MVDQYTLADLFTEFVREVGHYRGSHQLVLLGTHEWLWTPAG